MISTISAGQESGHGFVRSSAPESLTGYRHLKDCRERIRFQAHTHVAVGRIQFLESYWTEFLMSCWQEASLSSLPCGPLQGAACTRQLASWWGWAAANWRQKRELVGERACQQDTGYNVLQSNLGSAPYCFCHIPVRSTSLGPVHIQGEGLTQKHEHQEVGIIGGFLEVCLLQYISTQQKIMQKALTNISQHGKHK